MICPECGCEYREGFTHCVDCDVDLVAEGTPAEPEMKLVKIYEGGNAAVLPLIESLLRDADIEFMKRDAMQNLFALGRFGTGIGNDTLGPAEFWVLAEDEAVARELLAGVEEEA